MNILLAEDTVDLNRAINQILTMNGWDVDAAFDGEEALRAILKNTYDLCVLDIMMPKKNGIDVLKEVRNRGIFTPVLLLTAKSMTADKIQGLESGADDYLTKPFEMRELIARIHALTRRKYISGEMVYGDLRLNRETLEMASENSVYLSPHEFSLIQFLVVNRDRVVTVNQIAQAIWPERESADPKTVMLYIGYLERKLKATSSSLTIEGNAKKGFILKL